MATTLNLMSRKLLVFAAVYDLSSTTAAASAVGLTQSAVSKSVLQLEAEIGLTLFQRSALGLFPLPAADALRRRLRWIERELEFAANEMQESTLLTDSELRVGAGPVWNVRYLPAVLPEFHRTYPRIRLDIVTGSGGYLAEKMLDGELDLYFGMLTNDLVRPDIVVEPLFKMRLCAFVRNGHPLAAMSDQLAQIADFPWVGFSHDKSLVDNIKDWCRRTGIPHRDLSMRMMSFAAMAAVGRETDQVLFVVDALESELVSDGFTAVGGLGKIATIETGAVIRESLASLEPITFLLRLMISLSAK